VSKPSWKRPYTSERSARLAATTRVLPQTRQAGGGAQLEGERALAPGIAEPPSCPACLRSQSDRQIGAYRRNPRVRVPSGVVWGPRLRGATPAVCRRRIETRRRPRCRPAPPLAGPRKPRDASSRHFLGFRRSA
jgi:hypothetical protein